MILKSDLFTHLQQDVLGLKEEYLSPSFLLETMMQAEFVTLLEVPPHMNSN